MVAVKAADQYWTSQKPCWPDDDDDFFNIPEDTKEFKMGDIKDFKVSTRGTVICALWNVDRLVDKLVVGPMSVTKYFVTL